MLLELQYFVSVRWSHSERESLQRVYKETAWSRETADPPGQRAQIHVNLPPSAHLLFSLQRVYLVSHCQGPACIRVDYKLDLIVYLSLLIGVFLENRATSARVRRSCFLFSALWHSSLNVKMQITSSTLTLCFCSVHLRGSQTMPPASGHGLSAHEEDKKRPGDRRIHRKQRDTFVRDSQMKS